MNSDKRLAECTYRLLETLCDNCNYRDEGDPSCVKCSKGDYCNLKEMRQLVDRIIGNGE